MYLQQLNLTNFRNYENVNIELGRGINIFYGNNAQGKTNILEGIYFLALTKSHRTNNDYELLKENKESFSVNGSLKKDDMTYKLKIQYIDKKKKYYIDNSEIKKSTDFLSNLNVIIFYPDDIELIKGMPEVRRKFLNTELSQLYPIYFRVLNEYNKLLKMRNDLLKKANNRERIDMDYLKILNTYFVEKAVFIYRARKKFLDKLSYNASIIYSDISKNKNFSINYTTKPKIEDFSNEELTKFLTLKLDEVFLEEVNVGSSLYGPHRDDIEFLLDGKNLRKYGSQGQQKLSVLASKLAEINIFEGVNTNKPLLLLDDVFSEFDVLKKNNILKYINESIQTIVTTTELTNISNEILANSHIYYVENGIVEENKR